MKICNQYTVNFYYGWHFLLLFLRVLVDRGVAQKWALALGRSFPHGAPSKRRILLETQNDLLWT